MNEKFFHFFLRVDTLCVVLQRDTLSIRENRLFGAVVRWAEAECSRQQLPATPENKQKVLGKARPLIRFPLMTVEEFAAGKCFLLLCANSAPHFNTATWTVSVVTTTHLQTSCSSVSQSTETSLIFFLVQQGLPSLEY